MLLRLEPGTIIPRHRHTGEVHAFNIAGSRQILTTAELVRAGNYLYEPVGNIDAWQAVGDDVCIVHIEANGRVEYLDDDDNVVRYTSAATARADYLEWCSRHDIAPHPLLVETDPAS